MASGTQKVVDITPQFEGIAEREQSLKEDIAKKTLLVFILSNVAILIFICIIYFTSSEGAIINRDVIMALIGATTIQVGSIMILMAKFYFTR